MTTWNCANCGSVGKGELGSAFTAAQESDSSLTIDIDELLSQLDANGDGSLDQDELGSLLDYIGQAAARRSSAQENESGLIAKLLAQYQSSASYQSSIGSQLNLSA